MASPFVALDQAANLGSPFGSEVANGEVEGLGFGVSARGLTFSHHEILQPADVEAEGLCTSLAGDFASGREHRMEKWMVQAKEGVHGMIACLRGATLNGTLRPGARGKSGILVEGSVD